MATTYVTIEDFIASKPSITLDYEFLSLYQTIDDAALIAFNIINDYISDIKDICKVVTLSDDTMIKYKYNPKKLFRDVYGNGDLFFIILAINGMSSPKDFTKKKVNMLYVTDMTTVVTCILNAEKATKNENETSIS